MPAKALSWLGLLTLLPALAVVSTSASRLADAEPLKAAPAAAETKAKGAVVDPAGYTHHTYTTYKPPSHKSVHPVYRPGLWVLPRKSPDYNKKQHDKEYPHHGPKGPLYKDSPDYNEKHHDGEHPYYEPEGPWYKDVPDYHEKHYDEDHDGYAPKRPYYEDHYYPKPHYPKHKVYPKPPLPPPVCPFCPNNLTQCTSLVGTPQCLDLKSNLFSCGECNKVCPKYSTCINGNCTCYDGFTKCDDKCVDLTSDNNYCGNCTTACNATSIDQFCSNSTCVDVPPNCPPGETQCFPSPNSQGTCVNLKNNSNACGACNRRCNLQPLVSCVDGDCCIPPGGNCLLPGVGLLCCGFNFLSLVPGAGEFLPTATCEARGILGGVCCYGVNKECSLDNECCTDLKCTNLGALGKTCQPDGCIPPLDPCTDSTVCCAGFRCSNVPFLGRRCSPV